MSSYMRLAEVRSVPGSCSSVLPVAAQAATNLLTAAMAMAGVIVGRPGLITFRIAISS